jgi:AraC family transcriptional regulator, arabinose operon regulatory protein
MELLQHFHTPTFEELNSSVYIAWAGHRVCEPSHRIGPRILSDYKIVLIVKGRGTLCQEDKNITLSAGDIFVLFPGVKHLYYTDPKDPWELMWVSFNGNISENIMKDLSISLNSFVILNSNTAVIKDLLEKIIDSMGNEGDPHALKSTGYLYLLFSQLLEIDSQNEIEPSKVSKDEVINKALMFINLNYHTDIDVNLLCNYVSYSRSYFSKLFKLKVGLSIPKYINEVRIQRAKLLLKDTSLNICEIAKSIGFEDPFYFSKVFKIVTGISPVTYRDTTPK